MIKEKGLVIKAIASFFYIDFNGEIIECKASTKLKQNKKSIITGDYVMFDLETKYITEVCKRESELIRPKIANVSNVMLIFSATEPNMNYGMLDRMIVIMEYNNLETTIVITKMDLLSEEEKVNFKKSMSYYKDIGYKVFYSDEDYEAIKMEIQKDKYVFTGQTGVGKSTLINRMLPDLSLKTQPISKALGRGKHSTREVTFYRFKNSYIIDTPGFSSIDMEVTSDMIRDNYVDFAKLAVNCKFKPCNHINEPKCAVKEELGKSDEYDRRYENYVKIMDEGKKERYEINKRHL